MKEKVVKGLGHGSLRRWDPDHVVLRVEASVLALATEVKVNASEALVAKSSNLITRGVHDYVFK